MPTQRLAHLSACISQLKTASGTGSCFFRSVSLLLDLGGSAELLIGTFNAATAAEKEATPNAATSDFIHCWVEHDGYVFSPTTFEGNGNRLIPIIPSLYYETNGARDLHRLGLVDIRAAFGGRGLSAYLKHGRPMTAGPGLPSVLLETAGVKYKLNGRGGVEPA